MSLSVVRIGMQAVAGSEGAPPDHTAREAPASYGEGQRPFGDLFTWASKGRLPILRSPVTGQRILCGLGPCVGGL